MTQTHGDNFTRIIIIFLLSLVALLSSIIVATPSHEVREGKFTIPQKFLITPSQVLSAHTTASAHLK